VFVFYTADTKYITHFTERSASAHAGLALAMDQAKSKLNLPTSATFSNLQDPDKQAFLQEVIFRIGNQRPGGAATRRPLRWQRKKYLSCLCSSK
jgi:hypothetical protein